MAASPRRFNSAANLKSTRLPVRVIRRRLLRWYREQKRDLPWRRSREPYHIWVSEIMLQQTRVSAAIPYYERFLRRFPSVRDLATAAERDVLAAWAGLGYYTRARNLQRAAKKILEMGEFPSEYDSIRALDGVGDYTAAAVASIAFNLPHAAVDGNAQRVLSRLTAESGDIGTAVVRQRLRAVAERLLDSAAPGECNQAWMELGAVVCLPREPRCAACPLMRHCEARRLGRQGELPLKVSRAAPIEVEKQLLVIVKGASILAWQRTSSSARLAGFWELPELEQLTGVTVGPLLATFRHTIVNTHYSFGVHRARVHQVSTRRAPKGFRWLPIEALDEFLLSTAAKKALACLAKQEGTRR
ncbi:MAG TPA: A/G-specific adenine glycosylase [Bryobacteraceae bacterium]|nr:A/G-specific adenine glycosylase [Bryobacteraceae bacterium]